MNRKMKRTFLDFETKAEVIKKIKIGVEKEEILQKYEIGESSYYKFLRHESEIMNTLKKPENKHRRLFKKLKNEYLDDAVIKWFQQTRDRGVLVTGPMIREKAKVFNEKLNGPANFKASSGWLSKLKKRYNIKCSDIKGESFTYSTECIEEFSKSLKKKIINEKLLLENIYNADEAGIYWRTIVSAIQLEKLQGNNLFHLNNSNDLITVLFCSNASGNHRIPLLLIVNEDESACLENLLSNDENSEGKKKSCLNELSSLGIIYANQENSRICQKIFKDWFEEIFIPRALDFQRDSKISGKILLILDNAPCHPAIDELNAINKNIEVIEIPANVSAQLQPMSHGPINIVKKFYKQNILDKLLNFNTDEDVYKYLLNFNYKNSFPLMKNAWMNKIQESTLKNAWKHFLDKQFIKENFEIEAINDDDNVIEIVKYPEERNNDLLKLCLGPNFQLIEFSDTIFRDWYNKEIMDSGWNEMSDSDIVNFVQNSKENGKNLVYDDEDNDDDDYDGENSCEENLQSDDIITASKAYENLQIIKTWIRQKTSQLYVNNFTLEEIEKMLSQESRISPNDELYLTVKKEEEEINFSDQEKL